MAHYLNVPKDAHRTCIFVTSDGPVCGVPFVAMSDDQEVCPTHSDAHRRNKTKEKRMKDKPGQPTISPDSANALTNKLLVELPKHFPDGLILWRCNVGGAYPIQAIKVAMGMMVGGRWQESLRHLQNTRVVIFGRPGLPDIDGMVTIYGLGVRVGLEVKIGRDKQHEAQFVAERVYAKAGCIYIVARTVEQALVDLKNQVRLLKQQVELRPR